MAEILSKAGSFVAIILIGHVLRRINFFKEEDFHVLSNIVLKITLPGALIYSLAGKEISPSLLFISMIGLVTGMIYMGVMFVVNMRNSKEERAFDILNTAGCNIGNFTMPFVQNFLGAAGVLAVSLFDSGNAVICLGGAYSMASLVRNGEKFDIRKIINKLVHSVPFMVYVIMVILGLLKLSLPAPVMTLAGIISNANAFMAMLMLGVGFNLSGDKSQIRRIAKILTVRYSFAVVFALICFFLLPINLEYRQALAIAVFSPIGSAAPAFTEELKEDVGLSSAVNSISILISIVCIVALLLIIL
ncbi:MAG: AEC family transporter [Brotaphodocola sp.]